MFEHFLNYFRKTVDFTSSYKEHNGDENTIQNKYYKLKQQYNTSYFIKYLKNNTDQYKQIFKDPDIQADLYQHVNCARIISEPDTKLATVYQNLTTVSNFENYLSLLSSYEINCISYARDTSSDNKILLQSLIAGRNDITNYLLREGAQLSVPDMDKEPLFYAIENQNNFAIKKILQTNFSNSKTLLKKAITYLQEKNLLNDEIKNSGAFEHALFNAIKTGDNEFTEYLLNHGITTKSFDFVSSKKDGENEYKGALYYAIKNQNSYAIKRIIELGFEDKNLILPTKQALKLIASADFYNSKIIKLILKSKINYHTFKNQIFDISRTAAKKGDLNTIKTIVKKNILNTEELNKLIIFASGNHKENSAETVKHLLSAGGKCEGALDIANAASNNKTFEAIKEICSKFSQNKDDSTSEGSKPPKGTTQTLICDYRDLTVYGFAFSVVITFQKESFAYAFGKPTPNTLKSATFNFLSSYAKFIFVIPIAKLIEHFVISNICENRDLNKEIKSLESFEAALAFQRNHKKDYYLSSSTCIGIDIAKNQFIHLNSDWTLCEILGKHNDEV